MLKINNSEVRYAQVFIYNDKGDILYKTKRDDLLNLDLNINIRNARKLSFYPHDCFQIKTSREHTFMTNGKDLYIHNSIVDVIKVEEKKAFETSGEICYKDVYTLKLNYLDGVEVNVESDCYTRYEKTPEREYLEKLAEIISSCLYTGKEVSHYEVERMLKKLNITIK